MITVEKNLTRTVKVLLNQSRVNLADPITINFTSPSRSTIQLSKTLTEIGSGFYSFTVTNLEANQFVDDTYSYEILQGATSLKKGYVRLIVGDQDVQLVFDYTLDFTLS